MSELRTIEATGQSVVRAQPDVAMLSLGVITQAKKPKEALEENAQRMTSVIAAVQALGIPEAHMQSFGLNLQPIYRWDEDAQTQKLVGYQATNGVTVHTPVELAGPIYDAAVVAGANGTGGIRFTVTDDRKYRREALAQATKAAVEEILVVSKSLGATLITPVQAQVLSEVRPMPYDLALEKAEVGTPVLPGRIDVGARVRVVFAIK